METGPEAVKRIRMSVGLTQEKFAHEVGVTTTTVNRWERGHAAPSELAWRAIREVEGRREKARAEA